MKNPEMKNILVIGSKGFIGNSCLRYFGNKWKATGCDIAPNNEEQDYFQITSQNDFAKTISSAKFDVCINASGSANVGFSFENPIKDYELNVENVKHMLDALKEFNPDCRFMNFSSAAVYGNPDVLPIPENAKTHPLSPYGKNKLEAENLLKDYAEKKNLKTCNLRVFSAYGPELHKQLFWDIFQKSRKEKNVCLYGTGKESRDFIFIDDVLKAIDCVIDKAEFSGEVYNVASGIETTVKDAAQLFLSFIHEEHSVEFSGEEKSGDPINWKADISKLTEMNFHPSVSLQEGLKITAQKYLSTLK